MQSPEIKQAMSDGMFVIADIASQTVVERTLNCANNPQNILELCAGKGNKTIMLEALSLQKFGHQLEHTALDNVESKIEILNKRTANAGLENLKAITNDASNFDALKNSIAEESQDQLPKFDIVFVDAPCSGLGTLRRHPEIK